MDAALAEIARFLVRHASAHAVIDVLVCPHLLSSLATVDDCIAKVQVGRDSIPPITTGGPVAHVRLFVADSLTIVKGWFNS